jgi:deoxycytidylate deaminase
MTIEIPPWVLKEVNIRLKDGLTQSTCTKRQIAAVLWSEDGMFMTGWNGPPDCFEKYCHECPRGSSGSGEDMEICPAVHGEVAAILEAARRGEPTVNGVLFISCALPCKDCMKEIIRAGIRYIISPYPIDYVIRPDGFQAHAKVYSFPLSRQMMEECGVEYIHEPKLVKGR